MAGSDDDMGSVVEEERRFDNKNQALMKMWEELDALKDDEVSEEEDLEERSNCDEPEQSNATDVSENTAAKEKVKRFQCTLCESKFTTSTAMYRHRRNRHFPLIKKPSKKTTCPICRKDFCHASSMYRHRQVFHTAFKGVRCKFCSKKFNVYRKYMLAEHEKRCQLSFK